MNTDTQMRRRRHLQQIVLSKETHGLDEEECDKPASPSPLRWNLQWKTAAVVLAVCGVFAVLGVVLASWKSGSALHPPSIDEALAEESASAQPASSESASVLSHSIGPQIVRGVEDLDAVPGIGPSILEKIRQGACQ